MTKCDVKSFLVTISFLFSLSALATTTPILGTYGLLCWIPYNQTYKQAINWLVWACFQSSRKDAAIKIFYYAREDLYLASAQTQSSSHSSCCCRQFKLMWFFRIINYFVNISNVYKLHLYQQQVVLGLLTYLLTYLLAHLLAYYVILTYLLTFLHTYFLTYCAHWRLV